MNTELYRQCFPKDPVVRELGPVEIAQRGLPDTYWCEFQEDFTVWSPLTDTVVVPKGFLSDGASVPDFLWNVISDTAPYILFAGYGHDFIFSVQGILPNGKVLTLEECNTCIGFWMGVLDANKERVDAVLLGLAIGSKKYWDASKPPAKIESAKP